MKNEKYTIEEALHRYDPYMGRYTMEWSELLDGPIEGYIKSDDYIVRNSKGEIVGETKDKLSIEVTKRPDGSFWAYCKEYPHLSSSGKTYGQACRKLVSRIEGEEEETLDDLVNDLFLKYADDFSGTHMSMDCDGFKAALKEVLNKLRSNV